MTVYWLASPFSALVSFVLGGWLNELYGWRGAFFVMGLPALLMGILLKKTVVEPRLAARRTSIPPTADIPGIYDVVRILWRQRTARHLSIGIILLFTMGAGLVPWYAAFMIRSHAMGTAELGLWLGIIFSVGGIAGILLGGYVAERYFTNDERGQMRVTAVLIASLVPCFIVFLLVPWKYVALLALTPLVVAFSFFFGPTFALLQRLVVDDMRATTLAVLMLFANLIGMGVGPQIVGMLSDWMMPVMGIDSLRYAMLVMSMAIVWPAYHFWCVGRTVQEDLRAAPIGSCRSLKSVPAMRPERRS
jgi:MFS family permease